MTVDHSNETDRDQGSNFLVLLGQFDWLKIPGAVRAIAHLVTGMGEAGAAWVDVAKAKGEQRAKKIRDVTNARKSIMAATAKAGAVRAASSPELLDRMIDRLVAEQLKWQENREAIAIEAGQLLDENPPDTQTAGPSEDWLNVFSSHAEKATSDRLRQHWARVLVGEIRSPGTFSLATLQMFSILDPMWAGDITTARSWVADNDWIPMVGDLTRSPKYDVLLRLDSIGFLRLADSARTFSGSSIIRFQKHAILMHSIHEVQIPAALLTIQGKETLNIVEPAEDFSVVERIAAQLKLIPPVQTVQTCEIDSSGRVDAAAMEAFTKTLPAGAVPAGPNEETQRSHPAPESAP
jgi:hypothetical protein